MIKRTITVIAFVSLLSISLLSGCVQERGETDSTLSGSTQELKKFSSAKEVREFLQSRAVSAYGGGYYGWGIGAVEESREALPMVVPAATAGKASPSGASDYSTTNIQVEGVDEADFVKNDGKYLYVLTKNDLVIVDAYPAADAGILSRTRIPGRAQTLFLNDERLVIFTLDEGEVIIYPEYDFRPVPRYTPKTRALVYDISDREKPKIAADYNLNGEYFQSRMIGDYVYFIVKDSVYYTTELIDIPAIRKGSEKIVSPDVYYFDNPEENYVFHIIASFNIRSAGDINAKTFLMGYSDNLYVSEKSIYLTYRKNLPYVEQKQDRFYEVVVPLLPGSAQNTIKEIKQSDMSSSQKWERISSVLEETYNRMQEKEKQDLVRNIENALEEYDVRMAQEREKTVIHTIRIGDGTIEYGTRGEVPGTLLNQFSMDELQGYFRVATTSQFWTRGTGSVQFNNVYVLDSDLGLVGSLEKIAPDERIYSTRFIGNRLYMVTFKRIDPLFVIDLSNPKRPEILGELKIPGYSDYLHPYDERHIIGVGKETGENGWGGVSVKGVKLSLFDVSDVNHPRQLDIYEIGAQGTDSEALRDHKAFLFDKEKNLLVIPIREVMNSAIKEGYYGQRVWQGAYVFGLSPDDGFTLRGRVSHRDNDQGYSWNSPYAVRRSLYMDDELFTISEQRIVMNSLKDMSEIKRIDLS